VQLVRKGEERLELLIPPPEPLAAKFPLKVQFVSSGDEK